MKFAIRVLFGVSIAVITAFAAAFFPQHAVGIGWLGATLYFSLMIGKAA